jgi:ATP-dependent exoDNAse (exonuclease V) beta subunit
VWWDPSALGLGARAPFGVRREDLIVKDVARAVVADGRSRYDRWRLARSDAKNAGAVPSLVTATVGEWSREQGRALPDPAAAGAVIVADAGTSAREGARPGGARFGALVHAVLAQAPLDAPRAALDELALHEARLLDVGAAEALEAAAAVDRVLQHDLLARARSATLRGTCRRETPVACRLDDGTLVEGIVDLAFEEDGRWTVVDYKTDRDLASAPEEHYRRQIALYAWAIATATGSPVNGVMLRI